MPVPDNSREERKQILRDWMTSQIQMIKVGAPSFKAPQIADIMNAHYDGLMLNKKWTNRALYGHDSKIPKGSK